MMFVIKEKDIFSINIMLGTQLHQNNVQHFSKKKRSRANEKVYLVKTLAA